MRILIVDDNITFLEKSRNFLLEQLSSRHEIVIAEDGKKALSYLENNEVEIILLDISMPKMNGIEVAKVIQSKYKKTKFIFITAYDDVSYLKQAIKLNAFDYLLKPLDTVEFLQTVEKMIKRVKEEIRNENDRNREKSLAIEHSLLQLIENGMLIESFKAELAIMYDRKDWIYLARVQSDEVADLYGLLLAYVNDNDWKVINTTYGYAYIVIKAKENSFSIIVNSLYHIANEFKNLEDVKIDIYLSERIDSLMEISKEKIKFDKLIELKYFMHYKNVFTHQDRLLEIDYKELDSLYDKIIEIAVRDVEESFFEYRKYEKYIINKRIYNKEKIVNQHLGILKTIMDNPQMRYFKSIEINQDYSSEINSFKYFYELTDYVKKIFRKYIETSILLESSKPKILIMFMEYVSKHYGDEIDLLTISEDLYVSKSYLNTIIKKNMDCTVMQYVCDYRLEKACVLLSDTDLTIKEIAKKIGYSTSNYFIKVFRNKYETTPNEYRQRIKRTI